MVSDANRAAAMAILSALVFDFMTLPLEVPYPADRRSHTLFHGANLVPGDVSICRNLSTGRRILRQQGAPSNVARYHIIRTANAVCPGSTTPLGRRRRERPSSAPRDRTGRHPRA